ncbi:MAG: lysostaphin resistance A-like protein [bacterium]
MPELEAPATNRPSALGVLWRGHVFLFDKKRETTTFGAATGVRLLLIVAGLEVFRLARNQLQLSFLPFGVEVLIYLLLALAAIRFVAGVSWRQIGFNRWAQWNATERSYFVQVVILINVVFTMLFAAKLRAAFADPSVVLTVFIPYLIYGFYQEVLYRGVLQTELVRRWGPTKGILVSNALFTFGPLHYYYFLSGASLAVPMFASIFVIGLLFATVFHRTGNLWIVAIMHAFGNAYAVGTFGQSR